MNPHQYVYARLERVKALWKELSTTSKTSARCRVVTDEIRAEALAYRTGVDAARGVDRRRSTVDRRRCDAAPPVERRRRDRRK
jgi:hypothetical protein